MARKLLTLLLLLAYVGLTLAYSWGLKHIVVLDAMLLASGFIIRVAAGSYAAGFPPSEWLLICTGLFVHATFSALGLSLILARSANAFGVAKLAGAGYLAWLGVQSLRRATRPDPADPAAAAVSDPRSPDAARAWREGFLTNVLNPKVAVFYLAFLPQFVGPGDRLLPTFLLLAAIHAALGLVWLSLLASLLEQARGWLARPAARRVLEGVSGAVLVGFGARLALARR